MTDIIEKTPSPLSKIPPVAGMGEGWGGGEKPLFIELLRFSVRIKKVGVVL